VKRQFFPSARQLYEKRYCACGEMENRTRLADATRGTIRLKLLKIAALVKISVRRVLFSTATAFLYVEYDATARAVLSKAVCTPRPPEHPASGWMKMRLSSRAKPSMTRCDRATRAQNRGWRNAG
jgi:hypothetical protein